MGVFKKKYISLYANILVAGFLALFVVSPFYEYPDRSGYIERHAAPGIERFLRLFEQDILSIIIEQPLWRALNAFLVYFFSPEQVVSIIIALTTFLFIFSFLTLCDRYGLNTYYKFLFLFFFFFLAFLHKPQVQHIRQGFAISLFMLTFLLPKKYQNIAVLLPPLVHYSYFFTVLIYYCSEIFSANKRANMFTKIDEYGKSVVFGFYVFRIFLTFPVLAKLLDLEFIFIREYHTLHDDITGLGFLQWGIVLSLFIFQGKHFVRNNMFSFLAIVTYLATYFVFGSPGRLFHNAQPLILLSGFKLTDYRLVAFLLIMLFEAFLNTLS